MSVNKLAAGKERSFDPKDENPSNFQETSPYESLSNNLMCASASHTSKKDSVTFSVKGFPDPSVEDVDTFDKISGDEQTNKSPKENALDCEQIVRTQTEVDSIESRDFTETSNCNCTQASESVNEGFFEQEHQGPELVLSQVGMTFFMDEGEETEKYLGSSSTACALETLQVLPVSARSEEGTPWNELTAIQCPGLFGCTNFAFQTFSKMRKTKYKKKKKVSEKR